MVAGLLWKTNDINVLELKAAFPSTKTFVKNYSNITVYLSMDNTTAVAHINNWGGTRSPQLVSLSQTMVVAPSKINSEHRSALTRQTQESFTTPANGKSTSDPALP